MRRSVPPDEGELIALCLELYQERASGKVEASLVELVLVSRSIWIFRLYTTLYSAIQSVFINLIKKSLKQRPNPA